MDPDPDSIWMLVIMFVLLALSAFFSSVEMAFSSINKLRIKSMAQGGNKRAIAVVKLEEKYDKLLTTVLIGNNIVNIALSSIATIFFVDIITSSESLAATLSTIIVTVAVLIFGEITPKVIARVKADSYVMAIAPLVNGLMIIFTPLSVVFDGWSKLIHKLFRSKGQVAITEDELITIVGEAEEDGTLETDEGNLIRSAIEFNDVCAGDILTPRVDICAISKGASINEIARIFMENGYSRLPVYGEDLDDIVGILHEKDFFVAYHNNNKTVTKHLQKPVYVTEHIKLADLLQTLKSHKSHMAIVVDEYGGTMGIVTMEDIIEELIGDVWDEHDEVINEYKDLADGTVVVKCSADLDDFFERFEIELPDEEDMPQTVNGFIMKELEAFPQVGDSFEFHGLNIEIKKIGTKRVEEIKVKRITEEEKAAE